MAGRRALTALLAAPLLLVPTLAAATPAQAHGAPEDPVSRTLACAPGGPYEQSEVCQAALAASNRAAFDDWDYVRIPGVDGRDQELIPDGRLCSGGVEGFAGLDLARDDWPATELAAGAELTFGYRTTIPHQGTFRLYLTTGDHNPAAPLQWSDLDPEPFLTVADPELVDGAYQLAGQLPEDRSGRHIIYTIWENTDTPDTYYSCTDVVLDAPDEADPGGGEEVPPDQAVAGAPVAGAAPASRAPSAQLLPRVVGGAVAALLLLAITVGWQFRHRPGSGRRGAGTVR